MLHRRCGSLLQRSRCGYHICHWHPPEKSFDCGAALRSNGERKGTALEMYSILMPHWTYRPEEPILEHSQLSQMKGRRKTLLEPRRDTKSRQHLEDALEQLVNLSDHSPNSKLAESMELETY